jgi:hypothetical protein
VSALRAMCSEQVGCIAIVAVMQHAFIICYHYGGVIDLLNALPIVFSFKITTFEHVV